ncbi:MAG: RNA-binding cell elongation regulator Jag/EloR [Actinomycetota bacterium]
MEWVKTTAKTLPEAIDLALDNLGVDESEAEIVVVEEPRQGLFGRMRGTARVEARVKPKAIRPKNERNRNRKGGGRRNERNKDRSKSRSGGNRGGNQGGNNQGRGGGNNRNRGGKNAGGRGSGRGRGDSKQRNDAADGRPQSADAADDPTNTATSAVAGAGQKNRGRSGGRDRSGGGEGRQRRSKAQSNSEQDMKPKEESPVEDVAEHLETFLTGLTEAFGFDSAVSIDSSEEDVLVGQIEGQHGLLVGPKGRTLDAVQELARISCQRTVPSSVRIKVDVGGYRQKRVEALQAFAAKAADSAVEGATEVALEPMSPADRKAVHDALSEDDRVETRSVGSEPRRKVLVIPVVDADEDDATDDDQVDDGVGGDVTAEDSVNGDGAAEHQADGSADDVADDAADDADDAELVDATDED